MFKIQTLKLFCDRTKQTNKKTMKKPTTNNNTPPPSPQNNKNKYQQKRVDKMDDSLYLISAATNRTGPNTQGKI